MVQKMVKDSKPTVVSLFAGCGGLDLGFINAGYKVKLIVIFDGGSQCIPRLNKLRRNRRPLFDWQNPFPIHNRVGKRGHRIGMTKSNFAIVINSHL